MKNIITTIYEGLITWAEAIHAYRQSSASKHYYWKVASMDEFLKNFEEREYGPKLAILITFAAIACLEALTWLKSYLFSKESLSCLY